MSAGIWFTFVYVFWDDRLTNKKCKHRVNTCVSGRRRCVWPCNFEFELVLGICPIYRLRCLFWGFVALPSFNNQCNHYWDCPSTNKLSPEQSRLKSVQGELHFWNVHISKPVMPVNHVTCRNARFQLDCAFTSVHVYIDLVKRHTLILLLA